MARKEPESGRTGRLYYLIELAIVFIAASAFYLPGIAVAPLAGDPSTYELRCAHMLIDSAAQTHPLYILIGHFWLLLPWPNVSVGLSAFSALCGAGTIVLVYATVRRLSETRWGPAVAATSLAVAHTMWFHASIAEVYTLNTTFLAGMLYSVVRWYQNRSRTALCCTGFLAGVGVVNHVLLGLGLVAVFTWVLVVVIRERRPVLDLTLGAASVVIGLSLILPFLIGDAAEKGWSETTRLALWGGTGIAGDSHKEYVDAVTSVTVRSLIIQSSATLAAWLYNFCSPAIAFGIAGLTLAFRKTEKKALISLLWLLLLGHLVFAAVYRVNDFWVFLLPGYVAFAIAAGLGADVVLVRTGQRAGPTSLKFVAALTLFLSFAMPVVVYATTAHMAQNSTRESFLVRRKAGEVADQKAYFRFYLWPPKNNSTGHADANWIHQAFRIAPPGSILAFRQAYRSLALNSQMVDGEGANVCVAGLDAEELEQYLQQGRRVYVDSLARALLLKSQMGTELEVEPFGVLWQVKLPEKSPEG